MRNAAGAVLVALVGFAAGTDCAKRAETPAPSRVLRFALDAPVSTLDPTYNEGTTFSVLSNVYEPLVDYDRNLRLVPALAAEWSAPDDRTWLLKLRRGVKLHDGTDLAPSDVARAVMRAKDDPISEVRGRLETVQSVDVTETGDLRIHTSRPDPLLLHALVSVLVAKGASRAEIERNPIGTGPYRLTGWERGTRTEMEAFPGYWRAPARIARIRFLPVPAGQERVLALKASRLDVAAVPASVVPQRQRGFRIADSQGLTTYYLFISTLPQAGPDNPLRDRDVRQAMSLAVDRRALAKKTVGHDGAFAPQIVPHSVFGYAAGLPPPRFDAAAARALLGKTHRLPVRLTLTHRDAADALSVAQTLKTMLDAAGFEVTLRSLAWPELLTATRAQSVPLFLSRWIFDNGDAGSFLRDCLRSRHPLSPDGSDNAGYSNPEMDRLIDESVTVFDDHLRLSKFERVVGLAQEDVPLIPLFNQPDIWGVATDLQWEPRLDGRLLAYEMALRGQ